MYVRDPFQDNSPMMGIAVATTPLMGQAPTDAAAPGEATPQGSNIADRQARLEMLYKLQTLFIELDTWIDSTVFN